MGWNVIEWNVIEWNVMERNEIEQNGTEQNVAEQTGKEGNRIDQINKFLMNMDIVYWNHGCRQNVILRDVRSTIFLHTRTSASIFI